MVENKTSSLIAELSSIDWQLGIFAIIGAVIMLIGVLLTIRFLYIDQDHHKRINDLTDNKESFVESEKEKFAKNKLKNIRSFGESVSIFDVAIYEVEQAKHDNRYYGTRIDIGTMVTLFALGLIATTGFFENYFEAFILSIAGVAFTSIIHFYLQLRKISSFKKISI